MVRPVGIETEYGMNCQGSDEKLIADTVLPNGARFYNDHNHHPEYCTDICTSLLELVAQDKAGELLLFACQKSRNESADEGEVLIVKNNTDYHGRSYGTHENYLVSRSVDFKELVSAMVPFFVVRQIITGAGKVGSEGSKPGDVDFQISQRADFFEEVVGINTTARRPIFNTRDEPHADRLKYRRLHVISGDANRSEYATALKAGMAGLVLDAMEAGEHLGVELEDPVAAIRAVSRDPDLRAQVGAKRKPYWTALDLLEHYLEVIENRGPYEGERAWTVSQWRDLLDRLRSDPESTADRLDWTAKRRLYREIQDGGQPVDISDLKRLDLAYHLVDPELSLYQSLVDSGRIRRLVDDEAVQTAKTTSPSGTRAAVRAAILRRFGPSIKDMEWDSVTLLVNGRDLRLRMSEIEGPEIRRLEEIVSNSRSIEDLAKEVVKWQ